MNPPPPFIATAPARTLLASLGHGLGARAPFVLITGERGTGKSTLADEALRRWSERVEVVQLLGAVPEPAALAPALLELFGGSTKPGASATAVLERLLNVLANTTAGGRVAVVMVDDAHTLSAAHLLELHRLAQAAIQRQCPLEVLLVGLPAIEDTLDDPALEAVVERISVRAELATLSANDTREYLQLRPNSAGGPSEGLFSRKACRDIHSATLGVLASIEALAAESTRRALRDGAQTVSPEHVRAAANALRAVRADDATIALPPRQERAAAVTPVPRPARVVPKAVNAESTSATAAPSVTERASPASTASAAESLDAPQSPGSDDPRVKAWVARFGGSGVSIGVRVPQQPASWESEFVEEGPPVVTRRPAKGAPKSVTKGTPATGSERAERSAATDAPRATPVLEKEPRVRADAPLASASVAPVAEPSVPAAAPAAPAKARVKSRAVARATPRSVPEADAPTRPKFAVREEPITARPDLPSAVTPRLLFTKPAPAFVSALAVALLALAVSQREALGRLTAPLFRSTATFSGAAPVAPNAPSTTTNPAAGDTPVPPKPVPAKTASGSQFSIAVGSYPTRDMARAECDYLGRLVPMRVRVAPAGARGYRLLLGRYDDAASAEAAVRRLRGHGLLPDAKVVEVPVAKGDAAAKPTAR